MATLVDFTESIKNYLNGLRTRKVTNVCQVPALCLGDTSSVSYFSSSSDHYGVLFKSVCSFHCFSSVRDQIPSLEMIATLALSCLLSLFHTSFHKPFHRGKN